VRFSSNGCGQCLDGWPGKTVLLELQYFVLNTVTINEPGLDAVSPLVWRKKNRFVRCYGEGFGSVGAVSG
jgi:hypothetical protein